MSRRPAPLAPRAATPFLVALVSGAMCFLAVCALEAASGAARLSGAWAQGLDGAATVRVAAPEGRTAAEPVALAALGALADAPGVTGLRVLTAEETAALVAPWVGEGLDLAALPAPILIEVTLGAPAPEAAAMQRRLDLAAPGAVWDDHGAWRAPLAAASAAYRRLAFWAVGLMGLALATMVVTTARASLAGAAATVRTLRLLGAGDGMIARAFDLPIAVRALAGGAVGAAAAATALGALPPLGLAETFAGPWRPQIAPLVAAPAASAVLAWGAARLTILAVLRAAP